MGGSPYAYREGAEERTAEPLAAHAARGDLLRAAGLQEGSGIAPTVPRHPAGLSADSLAPGEYPGCSRLLRRGDPSLYLAFAEQEDRRGRSVLGERSVDRRPQNRLRLSAGPLLQAPRLRRSGSLLPPQVPCPP